MSRREVKGAIRRQILLVFFIPLVMAMVHISMAFPLIRRLLLLFGMANTNCTWAALRERFWPLRWSMD